MKRVAYVAVGMTIAAMISQNAWALERENLEVHKRDELFGRTPFFSVAIESGSAWEFMNFYAYERALSGSEFTDTQHIVTRLRGSEDGKEPTKDYIDGQSCPQVQAVLWDIYKISVPSFNLPGLTPPRPSALPAKGFATHGPRYTIWATATDRDGGAIWITIKPFGSAFDGWGESSKQLLEECWQSEEPVVKRDSSYQ